MNIKLFNSIQLRTQFKIVSHDFVSRFRPVTRSETLLFINDIFAAMASFNCCTIMECTGSIVNNSMFLIGYKISTCF